MAENQKPVTAAADETNNKPTLHHMNHSQSQRILWLLEELRPQMPQGYNLILHKRITTGANRHRAPPELTSTHPMGKAPQLVTASGRVIAESSAIAAYLIATYDTSKKFQPSGTDGNDWIRDEQLSSFAGATLGPLLVFKLFLDLLTSQMPFFLRPLAAMFSSGVDRAFVTPEFARQFGYLESELGEQDYFMGNEDPGRADFLLEYPITMIAQRGWVDMNRYTRVKAWRERCMAREAWKRGIEKGNGYDFGVF